MCLSFPPGRCHGQTYRVLSADLFLRSSSNPRAFAWLQSVTSDATFQPQSRQVPEVNARRDASSPEALSSPGPESTSAQDSNRSVTHNVCSEPLASQSDILQGGHMGSDSLMVPCLNSTSAMETSGSVLMRQSSVMPIPSSPLPDVGERSPLSVRFEVLPGQCRINMTVVGLQRCVRLIQAGVYPNKGKWHIRKDACEQLSRDDAVGYVH